MEDEMKEKWKILGVLAILGVLIIPVAMMPTAKAYSLNNGDVVFGKMWYPIPQIPEWHHACFYRSLYPYNIVQSDPHYENWNLGEKWWYATGQYEKLQESLNDRGIGGAERSTLSEIQDTYAKVAYGYVDRPYYEKNDAVGFAENRLGRHFDIVSYWEYKDKQVDGSSNSRSGWYYCAELVWAGYMYASGNTINLDSHDTSTDHRVYPKDVYHSSYVDVWYDEGVFS